MTLWPRRLGWRLAIAFACSVTAIGVLAVVVESIDSPLKPTKRARSSVAVNGGAAVAGARSRGASSKTDASKTDASRSNASRSNASKNRGAANPARAIILSRLSPSAPATLARSLGFRLQPTPGTIMLTHRALSLAPDIVPVVEILATGEVVLRRPMPVAAGPVQIAPLSGQGHGAGVILPVVNLDLLSPAARAALIGLLQLWLPERPVLPAKLVSNDMQWAPEAVRRLLSWVP
ncbi:MAG: hypothetical protein ACI9S9_002124 [Planctomycetota bacterium]|jgi:hypothetical protein